MHTDRAYQQLRKVYWIRLKSSYKDKGESACNKAYFEYYPLTYSPFLNYFALFMSVFEGDCD